jgi:hypothetical protein
MGIAVMKSVLAGNTIFKGNVSTNAQQKLHLLMGNRVPLHALFITMEIWFA